MPGSDPAAYRSGEAAPQGPSASGRELFAADFVTFSLLVFLRAVQGLALAGVPAVAMA